MSIETTRDPRTTLVREKYFSLRPKPLERWLWQQGLPQAAERVFWLHWEEGMKRGDWCSELALRQVARECCIDTSTVTRAYQALKNLGLIRREDPGRDPDRPFQQAIAITEVRIPRALLTELHKAPNRHRRETSPSQPPAPTPAAAPPADAPTPSPQRLSRAESAALLAKLSATERAAFFVASRDRRTAMPFDPNTALSPAEQHAITQLLQKVSGEKPAPTPTTTAPTTPAYAKTRRLSPLDAARLRRSLQSLVPAPASPEVFRQVLWSVEEGALRRFDPRLALNIALKKIREGAWTKPNRMPPNWLRTAAPETCTAA